jgi:hypothetical protein
MSENMVKGINALRCMLSSISDSGWNLIASAYWFVVTIGLEEVIKPYLDMGYEYVCTCQEDANRLAKTLGGSAQAVRNADILTGCSELVQHKKGDKRKQREMFVKKLKEANLRALKAAAHRKRVDQAKKDLAKDWSDAGETGISKRSLGEYRKYRAAMANFSKKKVKSQKDKDELEKIQLDYLAVKNAKDEILTAELLKKVVQIGADDGGMKGLKDGKVKIFGDMDKALKKVEEFPDDEQVAVEVEVAVSQVENYGTAVMKFGGRKILSIKDTDQLKEIHRQCQEKKVYTRMYSETKKLIERNNDVEKEMYFETIEKNFKDSEKKYVDAKAHEAKVVKETTPPPPKEGEKKKDMTDAQKLDLEQAKSEAKSAGKKFDKATITYNAALNVKFDVQDEIQEQAMKPEVELEDKKKVEIDETVKYLKTNPVQLKKMAKYKYDQYADLDNEADRNPKDKDLRRKALVAEKEFQTYQDKIQEIKDAEKKEKELEKEFGEPEDNGADSNGNAGANEVAEDGTDAIVLVETEKAAIKKEAKDIFKKGDDAVKEGTK